MKIDLKLYLDSDLPVQFLGPSPNGKKCDGCLVAAFSSQNLSGSKTSGFG